MVAYLMLGQDAADKLKATYTVFEDVTDSVGLAPYIEWAAANGIVGGYGDGKFGPYDTLTQYAFGKMLLTAIGYDSAKEGYTGAGWQKNVYGDAYAKGIYNGTESYAACTRDDAARMVLAALESEFVVYGDAQIGKSSFLINGHVYKDIKTANITVSGAWDTGVFVWETYEDLKFNGSAFDDWGNPGDRWTYDGEVVGFYEDATVKTYTTHVDVCDLLIDLGVAASSSKKVDLTFIYNGDFDVAYDDDEDFYYDTFDKIALVNTLPDVEHAKSHVTCDDTFVGGQGVVTKVFEMDGYYLVTEVATYLAEVESLSKNHQETVANLNVGYRELTAYGLDFDDDGRDLHDEVAEGYYDLKLETSAYAKGDMVLVTLNVANGYDDAEDECVVVDHELATGVVGKLTGYAEAEDVVSHGAGITEVNEVEEKDAFGFYSTFGYEASKDDASLLKNFVFYYDNYGNVIGMFNPDAITTYAVVDAIWAHTNRNVVVNADLVALDAAMTEKANVVKINGVKTTTLDEEDPISRKADENDYYTYYLYEYTVSDGDYAITKLLDKDADEAYSYWYGTQMNGDVVCDITFADGDDAIYYYDLDEGYAPIELTSKTQVLMRDYNGNYTAVVGFGAMEGLIAESVEVVYDSDDCAKVVFLNNVVFTDAKVTGYILDTDSRTTKTIGGERYTVYELFVGGEAKKIYVDGDEDDNVIYYGIYEVQFNAVGGNLVVKNVVNYLDEDGEKYEGTDLYVRTTLDGLTKDSSKVQLGDKTKKDSLTGVAIYEVDVTSSGDELTVKDVAYLEALDLENDEVNVDIIRDEDGKLTAIYVIDDGSLSD